MMTLSNFIQCAIYMGVLLLSVKPLGTYMARVYQGEAVGIHGYFQGFENGVYRVCGIDAKLPMTWKVYAFSFMAFNILGLLAVYALQRFQGMLPLNPMHMPAVAPDLSFNTAVSFATNTNWQGYGGETTLSYLTQMLGLGVQNFVSAAAGMAVLVALARGFSQRECPTIGNFWVDLFRSVFYILLPLSIVVAIVLVSQGVVQTFASSVEVAFNSSAKQLIALGPAASQVAIKQLGTNGGGFFNVNSAHPLENPTPFSNFIEVISILIIPAALCYTFGLLIKDKRQGWALLAVMLVLFIPCMLATVSLEQSANPYFAQYNIDQSQSALQPGGNMEGKELRFGVAASGIWAAATTAASNGSVNSMHDSFTPLGGLIPMWLMQLGEVVFGGVGSGLYGLIAFAILTVFIAGLMIGRTPEYLGKKIEAYEVKMVSLVILVPVLTVLLGTAVAVVSAAGKKGIFNPGAHGFSEVLYAFSSAGNNNGSAFGGLSANSLFYNIALGLAMFVSRYWLVIPILAVAGSLSRKKIIPQSQGTLPTHRPLFVLFVASIVVVVGALTFFPALALGPIVEHLTLFAS